MLTEPDAALDLAYEGRLRRASASMKEHRLHVVEVILDSVERLACETPAFSRESWNTFRADTVRDMIGQARYELCELRANR